MVSKSYRILLLLLLVSCSYVNIEVNMIPPEPEEKTMSFEASFDGNKDNGNEGYLWAAYDRIKVFNGTEGSMFVSTNKMPSATTSFTGFLSSNNVSGGGTLQCFWGLYPYQQNANCDGRSITANVPTNQNAVPNTYDPQSFVCVAKSTTHSLCFYNVCSLMKFRLSRSDIKTITIESNNNETLSGEIRLVVDEMFHPEVDEVLSGNNKIVLHSEENHFQPDTDYFLSLLPGVFSNGFTITFDGETGISKKVVTESLQLERSIIYNAGILDENLSDVETKATKNGFMCFRTDDNQIRRSIVDIFEHYGFRYSMAVNVLKMSDEGSTSISYLRELQDKGFQVCDHTPNHNTLYVDILNSWLPDFAECINTGYYYAMPLAGTDRTRLYLTREYNVNYQDVQYGADNAYQTQAGTCNITGDFSGLRQIELNTYPTFLSYCYIPVSNGSVTEGWYLVKSVTPTTLTLAKLDVQRNTDYDSATLQFATTMSTPLYIIQEQGYTPDKRIKVTLSESAQYALMLAGKKWFEYYGLDRPLVWVQPGGDHPWGTNEYIESALSRLDMDWAETQDNVRNLTYNYENKYSTSIHTGTWWDDVPLHLDKINNNNSSSYLELAKQKIADYYALNNMRTIGSHYRWNNECAYTSQEAEQSLVNYVESIVKFCSDNNIPLVTFSERKRLLQNKDYDSKCNIIPSLDRDICNRGKPDGYVLSNGAHVVTENTVKCIRTENTGLFCEIYGLGALEKQYNKLSFNVKGNWAGYVVVYSSNEYKPNFTNSDALQQLKVFSFKSTSDDFVVKSTNFDIPYDANYLWIRFISTSSNIGFINDISLTPTE